MARQHIWRTFTMSRVKLPALVAILFVVAVVTAMAHEMTFKGTVTAVEPGKITKLKVTVIDEKTRKPTPMDFEADEGTDIFRGTVKVKLADAAIQKGEAITVVVDHDLSMITAIKVTLPAKKK
jgi:hypothetical protein